MALSTYTELKASIASWLHRTDLTAIIPDFITIAEKRIVRDLIKAGGHTGLETSTTPTFTSNVAAITGLAGIKSVVTQETPPQPVKAVTLEALKNLYGTAGTGRAYCLLGSDLHVSPDASSAGVTLYYYQTPTVMSDSTTTNELFPNMSDAYLYAALSEGAKYCKQDTTSYELSYQTAIAMEISKDKFGRYGTLSVKVA